MSDEKRNRDPKAAQASPDDRTEPADLDGLAHEDALEGADAGESARAGGEASVPTYRYRSSYETRLVGVFEFPPEFPQKLVSHVRAKMERRPSSAVECSPKELMGPAAERAEAALAGADRKAINVATEALLEIESVLEVLNDIDVASSTASLHHIAQRADIRELSQAVIEDIKSYNSTGLSNLILQIQRSAAELNAAWFTALNVPLDAQGMSVLGIEPVPETAREDASLIQEF
jgi:hypothetical protein